MDHRPSFDELCEYFHEKLFFKCSKEEFAQFYLNWIGYKHVTTVLNDALKHGDLGDYIRTSCSTKNDIDEFIKNQINFS